MKIALLGDMAFFGKFSIGSGLNINEYFGDVSKLLKNFDYVIGNLETPFCMDGKPEGHKSASIKSDIENVEILNYLNIGIVNLANNHIYDYGEKGILSTKKILEENEIKYFGVDNITLPIEKNHEKVMLSGYCCYSTNGLKYNDAENNGGINTLDGFDLENKLRKFSEGGYYNIASIHAGEEHVNYPNMDHIELARKVSEKVDYVYYGHHPHVIQGLEENKGSLLAYSLGNFCFDDVYTTNSSVPLIKQTHENKISYILSITIENGNLSKYEIIPMFDNGIKIDLIDSKDEINQKIKVYSEKLKCDKENYANYRNMLRENYLKKRKSKRNIMWYLKRLRWKYVVIIFKTKFNYKNYNKHIVEYISERGHVNE